MELKTYGATSKPTLLLWALDDSIISINRAQAFLDEFSHPETKLVQLGSVFSLEDDMDFNSRWKSHVPENIPSLIPKFQASVQNFIGRLISIENS